MTNNTQQIKPISNGYFKSIFFNAGYFIVFTGRFFKSALKPPFQFNQIGIQCFRTGYQSLPLITLTGFIIGLVLTLQSCPSLVSFGAETLLPGMIANSVFKEIGPVITALLCAGKVGSSIGAELGSMRVTEQIDAMEVAAINPFKYLVITRVIATSLMIPMLVIYADAIASLGSFIAMNIHSNISLRLFYSESFNGIVFMDIIPALIKTVIFGFFIGMIACYKGYHASGGTEGVGKSANEAVVAASIAIFIIDMVAVQITDLL